MGILTQSSRSSQRSGGAEADRGCGVANTRKGSMKIQRVSSNYFDIIRMEWEGVEKAGVCGVDERRSRNGDPAGSGKSCEKRVVQEDGEKVKIRTLQKPKRASSRPCRVIRGLPPSTGPCATKYLKKGSIELKQHCLTYLRD